MDRDAIKISQDIYAPPFARFMATYGDWDLGDPMGTGATPQEAIEDLKQDAQVDDE